MKDLKQNPTIADMQEHLLAYVAEQGWDDKSDTEVFLMFMEEVGELAKEIRRKHRLDADSNVHEETEGEFSPEPTPFFPGLALGLSTVATLILGIYADPFLKFVNQAMVSFG